MGGPTSTLVLALAMISSDPSKGTGRDRTLDSDGFPVARRSEIYPLADVRRGQRGVAYTVFSGSRPEPYEVEILGVIRGMLGPDQDLILARLEGKVVEFTGVVSGMSGSPVFMNGRLLGAVSYRFGGLAKEPIAGITPVESMLPMLTRRGRAARAVAARSVPFVFGRYGVRAGSPSKHEAIDLWGGRRRASGPPFPRRVAGYSSERVRPISIPLEIGGLTPSAAESVAAAFDLAGMPVHLASSTGQHRPNRKLVSSNQASVLADGLVAPAVHAASPIKAILCMGDVWIAGTGTVTLLEGDELLAFGHPLAGLGSVALPMATAGILNTLAEQGGSYWQSSPGRIVGRITQDGLTAIVGQLGQSAPMIPVTAALGASLGMPRAVRAFVASDRNWLGSLVHSVLLSATTRRIGYSAGGTASFSARWQVDGTTLEVRDSYAGARPQKVAAFVARDIAQTTLEIARNGFQAVQLEKIDVAVDFDPVVRLATVERVRPSRSFVRPGDKISAEVHLRDFRGGERMLRVPVAVPRGGRGPCELVVGGGLELDRNDDKALPRAPAANLTELLGRLANRRPAKALYARVYCGGDGAYVGAESLPGLPPSVRELLLQGPAVIVGRTVRVAGPPAEIPGQAIVTGLVRQKLELSL